MNKSPDHFIYCNRKSENDITARENTIALPYFKTKNKCITLVDILLSTNFVLWDLYKLHSSLEK